MKIEDLPGQQVGIMKRGGTLLNDCGVPYPIFKAILNDPYTRGNSDYSVSQLFDGPRLIFGMRSLPKGFKSKISDRLQLFEGSCFHDGIEHRLIEDQEFLVEQRLFLNVMINGRPVTISGAFDCYEKSTETLYDFKTTQPGGWKMRHKKMPAYSQQLNIYKLLMRMNKLPEPQSLAIIFVIKGWNQIDSYSNGYPENQFMLEPVEVMDHEEIIKLVRTKIIDLEHWKDKPISEMPYCSELQRWEDLPKYKVCKYGKNGEIPIRQKAIPHGVFDKQEDAEALQKKKGSGYFWTIVGGEPKRCLKYCEVAKAGLCDFGTKYNAEKYNQDEQEQGLLPNL